MRQQARVVPVRDEVPELKAGLAVVGREAGGGLEALELERVASPKV